MSDYNRTTRECPVNQLRPELFLAVRDYFREHKLGDAEFETLLCYETTSTKKSTNKLTSWLNAGLDTTVYNVILFTSQWLVWVRSGDRSGLRLASAELKQISVQVYASMLPKEFGVEIAGGVEEAKGMMRGFVAMGSMADAEKFCSEANQAIVKVRPPAERGIAKWWGGFTK